jgi:hypothetical protein
MARLRDKFLNVPLAAVLHPPSSFAKQAAEDQQTAAAALPVVTEEKLKEAQQPRYLFGVKVEYQDEFEK